MIFIMHKLILVSCCIYFVQGNFIFEDYKSHPCIRKCDTNTRKMVCKYNWTIEWYSTMSKACLDCPFNMSNCFRPHCVTGDGIKRPIITINRMLPGPSIIVCQNDEIQINLLNSLHMSEGTSIHWHGLHQRGTQYMDGVSMVTQCPINSHTRFEYKFNANEAGTHFWHAHSGLQRADGIFGSIIVHEYENDNPFINAYDHDFQEHVIIVNDWINETIISKFSGQHHNDGGSRPNSILINGKGVLKHFYDQKSKIIQTPREVFFVEQGKRYRFRVINAGILYCPIEFSIEGHSLEIIASDGHYVHPFITETFIIYAGERFDFILKANQTEKNYWIRTKGFADCSPLKCYQTAILSYKADRKIKEFLPDNPPKYEEIREGMQLNPWNTIVNGSNSHIFTTINQLKAIKNQNIDYIYSKILNATKINRHYFAMEFHKINNPEFHDEKLYSLTLSKNYNRSLLFTPQINNISFHMPDRPVLYDWHLIPKDMICNHVDKKKACPIENQYCSCIYTLEFDLGEVVEFVIVDEGFTFHPNHPMHLHGISYAVLALEKLNRSIKMDYVRDLDKKGLIERNFDHPPFKDTVTVPVGGYTIIRFLADNPGTWMFHCHLDFHSEIGMGLLIKIGKNNHLPKEPTGWPKCGNFAFLESSSRNIYKMDISIWIIILTFNFKLLNNIIL